MPWPVKDRPAERIIMERQTVTDIWWSSARRPGDFVNPDGDQPPEQVQQAMTTYCETYATIFAEESSAWRRGRDGRDQRGTSIYVNGVCSGTSPVHPGGLWRVQRRTEEINTSPSASSAVGPPSPSLTRRPPCAKPRALYLRRHRIFPEA